MKKEYLIQDIWIVSYSVPYKPKNKLLRPFIITYIINGTVYGIPLTSYNNNRYRPDLDDSLIKTNFLEKQSIIKSLTNELAIDKAQLNLIQKDRELLFETANNLN